MGGIIIAIILIAALILTFSVLGIGGDFWSKITQSVQDAQDEQKEQSDPDLTTTGNYAKDPVHDTNGDGVGDARVCDLQVTFVGSVFGHIFDDGLDLYHGEYRGWASDDSIVKYQWRNCIGGSGPESINFIDFVSFNWASRIGNPQISDGIGETQNVYQLDENKKIKFFFTGESINNERATLFARQSETGVFKTEFNKDQRLDAGTQLPSEYNVSMWLYGVTEDDYYIEFWNPDYKVNDNSVNKHYTYNICKPTPLGATFIPC